MSDALESRGIFVRPNPRWIVFCEHCDWMTEEWAKGMANAAARKHAKECPGGN